MTGSVLRLIKALGRQIPAHLTALAAAESGTSVPVKHSVMTALIAGDGRPATRSLTRVAALAAGADW